MGRCFAGVLSSFATIPVLTLSASLGKSILPPRLDPLGILLLIVLSVLVASVAKGRRRIEQVLRQANEVLEIKVAERTKELL